MCAILVWRKSMPCSGVPPCVPVRPGLLSCIHSCLKSTSTARIPHCRKTNDTLPFWWCIRENVPAPPFAATGTDRTVAAASSGNHDLLSSGTTTTALALQPYMCWCTTATICGGGRQKKKHVFAEPDMCLMSWPSTSSGTVSKMATPCLRHGHHLVSIVRTYRSPSSPYRSLPILPISGRNTVALIVHALPPPVELDRPRLCCLRSTHPF